MGSKSKVVSIELLDFSYSFLFIRFSKKFYRCFRNDPTEIFLRRRPDLSVLKFQTSYYQSLTNIIYTISWRFQFRRQEINIFLSGSEENNTFHVLHNWSLN